MNIDGPTIAAACAALSVGGGVIGWVAKHFVRDVVDERRTDEDENTRLRRADEDNQPARHAAITASDLESALARCEVRLLEKFNGRYPSKEVFNQGMENLREGIAETRKYIGDAKRELSNKIDGRIGGLESRLHDLEAR